MKKYNKDKLNAYAKELFELCLEKGITFDYHPYSSSIDIRTNSCQIGHTYICERMFNYNDGDTIPIWLLIRKVEGL